MLKVFMMIGLIAVCASGCSDTGDNAGAQDDTGTVSFQVQWAGAPELQDDRIPQSRALDCSAAGIATVTFEILDESDTYLVGQTWACSVGHGTVSGVPAGANRTLVVEGKDAADRVRYRGTVPNIQVVAGEDSPVGTVDCQPMTVIEYAYVQYRTYESGDPLYRGWVELTHDRLPIEASDVAQITLKEVDGTPVSLSGTGFWSSLYYKGDWNESASTVDFSGPITESGFTVNFPDTSSLSAGWYTYEVITRGGDLLTAQVNFPGQTSLPFVKEADMNYQWFGDGSLYLSWSNPVGEYDQTRVVLSDQDWNDLLSVKLPPDETALTIPAAQIQKIIDLKHPESAWWVVQTRSYTDTSDANNYARGISNPVSIMPFSMPSGITIHVPGDYSSIQTAIDFADNGDTVLVADGTYTPTNADGFDFNGKAITVRSQNGPESCTIKAGSSGRGVTFHSSENVTSVLSGFMITGGVIDGWSTGGGGILVDGASPTIQNCIIYNNRTENIAWGGGGISCVYGASPTIVNCIIDNNFSLDADGGGGIYCDNASPIIRNCTIVNNSTNVKSGGGIYTFGPTAATITNTILWNNSPDQIDSSSTGPVVSYSNIEGGFAGTGNIASDPSFVGSGNYALASDSPCIDTGTASGAPDSDIIGTQRPQGNGYDMGAYEYQ